MPTKLCTKCGGDGPFNRNKNTPDGLHCWCKHCLKAARPSKAAHAEQMRLRRQTPHGRAEQMWAGITSRAANRDGRHPAYANVEIRISRDAFMAWAVPELALWFVEHPGVVPSVDRRQNKGHYEIGNLRIISLSENSRLQEAHRNVHAPSGMAWCGECAEYSPVDNFYKNVSAVHGLQFRCKQHTSAANVASRARKRDKEA